MSQDPSLPSPADLAFGRCLPLTDRLEGGKGKDTNDNGGYTVTGCIQSDLDEYNKIHGLAPSLIEKITEPIRRAIFRELYFDRAGCAFLQAPLDFILYQFAVNKYPSFAVKELQKIVGAKADGQISENGETVTKCANFGFQKACLLLLNSQLSLYVEIIRASNSAFHAWLGAHDDLEKPHDQREFADGWLNRCINAASLADLTWTPGPSTLAFLNQQHENFKAGIPPA
jgi:hypothetical protein